MNDENGNWIGALVLVGLVVWGGYSLFLKEENEPAYEDSPYPASTYSAFSNNYNYEYADAEANLAEENCNPNYSGCLEPYASDYDCAGGSGNGPYYTGPVQVIGYDEYGLDR